MILRIMRDISVTDFVRNFADLINGVAYRGDRLRLRRGKRVLAEVIPSAPVRTLREFADIMKHGPHLSPGDVDAFGKDVDAARAELNKLPIEDRWGS